MITLTIITLFGLGCLMLSMAAGLIGAGLNIFGFAIKGVGFLLGLIFIPLSFILLIVMGVWKLLPVLLGVGLTLLVLSMIRPATAQQ